MFIEKQPKAWGIQKTKNVDRRVLTNTPWLEEFLKIQILRRLLISHFLNLLTQKTDRTRSDSEHFKNLTSAFTPQLTV